ncbi:MAG: phage tail assembly protein [Wohlfahrtiimonas sp.]
MPNTSHTHVSKNEDAYAAFNQGIVNQGKEQNKHSVTVTLEYPFTNGIGEFVGHVALRRPTLKEIRIGQSKATPMETELYLMTMMTGMVIEDLDLMDGLTDYKQLQTALQDMGKPSTKKK